MKNRLLYGFGGCGNFGDDYMLDRWISFYEAHRPDLKVVVARPDQWLGDFYANQKNFELNTKLHSLYFAALNQLSGLTTDHIAHHILAGKKAAFDALGAPEMRPLFSDLEALQMFGGGYLNRIYAGPWGIASMLSEISIALGVPLIATGVGMTPPFKVDRKSVDELISRFELIEVRDEQSYSHFANKYPRTRILLGQDDSFILPVRVDPESLNRPPRINICIQSNLSGDAMHPAMLERLLNFVKGSEDAFEICYLRFHDDPDQIFFEKLESALGRPVKSFSKDDMLRNGIPIAPSDICVTTRFHLHLLAARIGAMGAYILTGDSYYATKHKSVSALGSGWIDFMNTTETAQDLIGTRTALLDEKAAVMTKQARLSPYLGTSAK